MPVGKDLRRFNSNGKQIAVAKDALAKGGDVVGVWKNNALVSDSEGIRVVAFSPLKTAAKKAKSKAE